jgi:spore coat protein U-like protein
MIKNGLRYMAVLLLALPLPASALCLGCSCTADASVVAFGTYNPFGPNVDGTGNVRVACTSTITLGNINYSIALNKGANSTAFSPRRMYNSSDIDYLNYDLYTSNAYSTIWGDGSGTTGFVAGSIAISVLFGSDFADHPVYGRIPSGQTAVHTGNYLDTILVTVTYN